VCPLPHAVFDFIAHLILVYVVIMICKGWTISTNHVADQRVCVAAIGVLTLLYIALFIWAQKIIDPASTLYIYETPPGWAIVGVHCALTAWALWSTHRTLSLEIETVKRQFYCLWCTFACLWLMCLPLLVGAAHNSDTWIRQRVVFGGQTSITLIMYGVLTYLFRPFSSNRYFTLLKPGEQRAFGDQQQVFPENPDANKQEITFTTI
jgi:hypothetical protein